MEMKNSSRFFCNKECEYFPCHEGIDLDQFNCLFCYCPMNCYEDCLGNPKYFRGKDGQMKKDCTECDFPHKPENYDRIIEFLKSKY